MTDEERQRTMDFILAQQAQFWESVQKLEENHARFAETQQQTDFKTKLHDHQLDRLERVLKLVIKAGMRERKRTREQNKEFEQRMAALRESQAAISESQAHSDKRLDALIDIVRKQRNGES